MRRALELAPRNVDVVLAASRLAAALFGRVDEAIELCRRAIALDPFNALGHRYLGLTLLNSGLLEEAEAALKQALELDPLGGMTRVALGQVYLAQGRFPEALAEFEKESHEGFRLLGLSMAYHALGQKTRSSAALEQLGDLSVHAYLNAQANAYCGNLDVAFQWLEHAYAQRNAGLPSMKLQPSLRALHGDPRWRAFLAKMRFAE
jgi:tetratricopeptide (TPR) repeat protein